MADILLIRTLTGFAPADDEAQDMARRHKVGSLIQADLPVMRNGLYFRKWWALVKLGFEYFEETCPQKMHKGKAVLPNFNHFRKDITILAGHYHPIWNINGEMRLEADSLKWSTMTEPTFDHLYNKTVQVLLSKVFTQSCWSEAELKLAVDRVLEFAA